MFGTMRPGSNLIVDSTRGSCPAGEIEVLTRVSRAMFLYTPLQCSSPGDPACAGPTLQCRLNVCCTSYGSGPERETPTLPASPSCQPACRMGCEFGLRRNAMGCPQCACRQHPCEDVKCNEGEKCTVTEYACGNDTCYTPHCISDVLPSGCPSMTCNLLCPEVWDSDPLTGCPLCQCRQVPADTVDLCQGPHGLGCPSDRRCEMQELPCLSPPCPKVPVCVKVPDLPCARIHCRISCPYGFARDANDCEICMCKAAADCSQMDCGFGKRCQVLNNQAVCVDIPDTPCARIQCRMLCPHGLARDANNCEICACNTPPDCSQMDCGKGRECEIINDEAVCVDIPDTPCARIQCRMFCPRGFARDANNCEICTCNTPPDCSQTDCGEGRECKMINNEAVCVDIPQTPCSRTLCRMYCPQGFARDANNCEVCKCHKPTDCSQMRCEDNTECAYIQIEGCNEGSCLEPICIEKPSPTTLTTTATPLPSSSEEWRQRFLTCFFQRIFLRTVEQGDGQLPDFCL